MARPLRIQYPHAVYHVINRGLHRRNIFLDERDRFNFLDLLQESWKRWKIEVFAYCLMSNHYHLCFRTPEAKLSRIMRHINGLYTQRFNKRYNRDGPLFKGRFKAMVIEEQEYLAQIIRYIHLNPVKAGMVKNPQDYQWSSHRAYLQPSKAPLWLAINKLGDWFESPHQFHEFIMEGNEKYIENVYKRKRWPVILGNQFFIESLQNKEKIIQSKEHIRAELEYVRPGVERVLEVIKQIYKINITEVIEGGRGRANEARKVAIWFAREACDYPHEKIAEIFNLGSSKTVSWACSEVKQLLNNKKKTVAQKINKIKQKLQIS